MQLVDEVELLETGLEGRPALLLRHRGGPPVNNKDCGPLQLVRAEYDERADVLTLHMPDGTVVAGAGRAWGRGGDALPLAAPDARGSCAAPGPRPSRASWAERSGSSSPATAPPTAAGRRSDPARDGVARALAEVLGVEQVDERRFRMNFGIDGLEAHAEDGWLGRRVAVGAAVVVPQGNVGRCVVTTQSPETGRTDLGTLKALAAYRGAVETTEPLPFGVHAAVVEPGRVRVGDLVQAL